MSERVVNIAELIAPSFDNLFYDVQEHRYTHYWLAGGRGSTKSSFASLCVPLLLLQNPLCHVVVLRKVANTLRNSVYNQVEWAIDALGLSDAFAARVSPLSFEYRRTGQKILFLGVDDKSKIKSLKLPFGYVGIVWMEEHIIKKQHKRLPLAIQGKPLFMRLSGLKANRIAFYAASAFCGVLGWLDVLNNAMPECALPLGRECVIDRMKTAVNDGLILLHRWRFNNPGAVCGDERSRKHLFKRCLLLLVFLG